MVTEEQETRRVPCRPEVDDHHAVLGRLHEGFEVAAHDDLLLIRQVAYEHRILDPRAEPLHAPGDATESAIIAARREGWDLAAAQTWSDPDPDA